MKISDQHTTLMSLYQALVPGETIVDGRSERDRLAFFSDFASLINFYDQTNQVNGNWRPFLLKDPVFLLAHIASLPFQKWQSYYQLESRRLQALSLSANSTEDLAAIINSLSNQLIEVFLHIERWTVYMQQSVDYDLKKYVLHEVKNTFSEYFWAFLSFRDAAYRGASTSGLEQVDYFLFESFDELIWKISRGKRPYWQVIQIDEELISENQTADQNLRNCYQVLIKAGEAIFSFLHTIVQHAPQEYERVKKYRSHYPDTTLLRTFERLLRIYQNDQNRLAEKHLDFYYRDILKQRPRKAIPDTVFVCAEPTGSSSVYTLKAGTSLNAGQDSNSNQIIFETTEDINVNPASILSAHTVSFLPNTSTGSAVYLQAIPTPGQVVKDEQDIVCGWPTFGGASNNASALQVTAGLILATPIFLLQEGDRTINIEFSFEKEINLDFLTIGNHYLSTQTGWLNIRPFAAFTQLSPKEIQLHIQLPASEPAVVPFVSNPEKVSAEWPMLKMEFNDFPDPTDPPVLTGVLIHVAAGKFNNVQLFNDNGGLSPKGPFPLFGNMPQVNSHFVIGSAEVFSKPLESLYLEFEWDSSLPKDFQLYYQPYNNYINTLNTQLSSEIITQKTPAIDSATEKGLINSLGKLAKIAFNPLKKLILLVGKGAAVMGKILGKSFKSPAQTGSLSQDTNPSDSTFNNSCFTVQFSMLDQQTWNLLNLRKMTRVISPDGNVSFSPYQDDSRCAPSTKNDLLLYGNQASILSTLIDNDDVVDKSSNANFNTCVTVGGSYFGLNNPGVTNVQPFPYSPNAAIQHSVLKYSDQSSTGFIRMTLTGPSYGFGSTIYPNVVADIALKNAIIVSKKATKPPTPLNNPANPPFVPKVNGFQLHYTASVRYAFNQTVDDYPLQCFSFSPIHTGIIYDQSVADSSSGANAFVEMPGAKKVSNGVTLYPAFPYNGTLLLGLENVISSVALSLYFQLAKNYSYGSGSIQCNYAYLTDHGWNPLPLLSDSTHQFGSSGIVTVSLPENISNDQILIGEKRCWISIGVSGDISSVSDTVFLKTNGVAAKRVGNDFQTLFATPTLDANQITRPVKTIPQIASFLQPFASFGGKSAEDNSRMHQRVSNRLKTKDRAVTSDDFYRLVKLNYPDVFYVKTIYDNALQSTNVYIATAIANSEDANAFMPFITKSMEADIQSFLQQRSSVFASVAVSNFSPQFLEIQVNVELLPGYQKDGITKKINNELKIFLSPWISSKKPQIKIDQGITDTQVAAFISSIEGVNAVNQVCFNSWILEGNSRHQLVSGYQGKLLPIGENRLFISASKHLVSVTIEKAITV